ncbi:MAG: DUF2244 domain-containing protein [Geminicoccaceae bacterium]
MTPAYESQEQTVPARFEAVIYPNHSLGSKGFFLLMGAIVLVSGLIGAGFAIAGAWPVAGFLGLDVLLLYLAFRWHLRHSRQVDLISVDQDQVAVRRTLADDKQQVWHFETAWVQVCLEDRQLKLRSHGKELVIGTCLTADERRALAQSLKSAIQAHRDVLRD